MNKPTVIDTITDRLAFRIATGQYPPGDHLPSVRDLADEFDISRPSAQMVLGRLESLGFAVARRGSGFTVRDVRLYGNIETWRFLFRFSRQLPDTAVRIMRDVMDLFQAVGEHLLTHMEVVGRRGDLIHTRSAVDRFSLLASNDTLDHDAATQAIFHVLRTATASTGQVMVLAVVNSVADMFHEVPEAAQALCESFPPAQQAAFLDTIVRVWEHGTRPAKDTVRRLDTTFELAIEEFLERFRELLTKEATGSALAEAPAS